MMGNTDQILELLFGTRRLDEVSVSDLNDLLEEFPSFNAAHYLLSKKLKMNGSEEFSSETQKTALYFTNPFWLHWLLEAPEPAAQLATEMPVAAFDITGSESSVWNDHLSGLQEPTSFFEESITTNKEVVYEHAEETSGVEMHRQETHFSAPNKNIEVDAMGDDRLEDYLTEHSESPVPATEIISDPFISDTNYKEEIFAQTDSEYNNENPASHVPLNGLDFQEPGGFREEPVPSVQKDGADIQGEVADHHEQPWESSNEASTDDMLTHPEPAQEETRSRSPFFWEKEFQAKVHNDIAHPVEEETTPIAQIPELEPFQDNPAFLLVETESQVPVPADEPEKNANPAPPLDVVKAQDQQDKEPRIFFKHHSANFDPASIREENLRSEPLVQTTPETITEQSFANSEITVEHSDTINTATSEMVNTSTQEVQHKSNISATENPPDELQFTPYHTIDYFASQGIRFIQEENPTDKFGKQLKSFTAWLKTMKRLPKTLLESEMSAVTEAAIQDIAEHSIEEKEVITETMAQVLALQGQSDKAIELYRKLSLLNPSKSAYFAARIEQIKSDLT